MADVIIKVEDGVAEVVEVPEGVRVIIRDYDVQEETGHQDEEGNFYEEGVYILEDGEVVAV